MGHDELVAAAARWLRREKRCGIVVTELVSGGSHETPDAVGWAYCGRHCYSVECKVSRADFRRDARKGKERVGQERYYLVPPGLLKPDELPDGWGLLEWDGARVAVRKEAAWAESCWRAEAAILYSVILRQNGKSPMPRKASIDIEPESPEEVAAASE